jgi:hypothetical protein
MNDGDWVESCTALVEHMNGKWELITWTEEIKSVANDTYSSTYKQSKRHTRQGDDGIQDTTTMP